MQWRSVRCRRLGSVRRNWLVVLAAVAGAVYLTMWTGYVMRWRWLADFDDWALSAFYHYGVQRPGWVFFWDVLCTVLGPTAFRLAALVLIVVAAVRRHWHIVVFLLVSVGLSGLVTAVAKLAANRPRPATELVSAPWSSFPSGHAITVMAGVLALSAAVLPMLSRSLWGWVIVVGALTVVAIGVGRVVLNVHHPSDVLAGWALGFLWFAACLPLLTRRTPPGDRV